MLDCGTQLAPLTPNRKRHSCTGCTGHPRAKAVTINTIKNQKSKIKKSAKWSPHKIKNKNHILVQSIRVTPKPLEPGLMKWQTMTVTQPSSPLQCEVQRQPRSRVAAAAARRQAFAWICTTQMLQASPEFFEVKQTKATTSTQTSTSFVRHLQPSVSKQIPNSNQNVADCHRRNS